MATALISQPVLPANAPAALAAKPVAKAVANCDTYIDGLLDELRGATDQLPVVPGQQTMPVDYRKIYALRGVVSELIIAVRNDMRRRG